MAIITYEDYLEHFGTKGMKWGVRKGKKETGMSRTSSARIDRNNRIIKEREAYTSGKKSSIISRTQKRMMGEENWKAAMKQTTKTFSDQNKRIKAGKATTLDRLDMAMNTSVVDLMLQRK